jgi:hypothetical protein
MAADILQVREDKDEVHKVFLTSFPYQAPGNRWSLSQSSQCQSGLCGVTKLKLNVTKNDFAFVNPTYIFKVLKHKQTHTHNTNQQQQTHIHKTVNTPAGVHNKVSRNGKPNVATSATSNVIQEDPCNLHTHTRTKREETEKMHNKTHPYHISHISYTRKNSVQGGNKLLGTC